MTTEPAHRTARQRARDQITAELLAAARRQLAEDGPAGLSLRSVARELGMVSSAVYRYFESRDALLTRLIVDAYDALGTEVEAAAAGPGTDLERWLAAGRAVRAWALAHPQEYALLYGSPVPGYAAPEATVASGIRPSRALVGIVAGAAAAGRLAPPAQPAPPPPPESLTRELEAAAATLDLVVPPEAAIALIAGWTQLFGLVAFELFGQTRNMVTDHAALFDATVTHMGHRIGLR